jgi:chlorite dismutase
MARGFESKDVEFQQSEAERPKSAKRMLSVEERDAQTRRVTLELALARAESDLSLARSAAHRQMLQQALAALREQIRQITVS